MEVCILNITLFINQNKEIIKIPFQFFEVKLLNTVVFTYFSETKFILFLFKNDRVSNGS